MIKEFQGEHRWLSNFWPCSIEYQGKIYPSVEHFYVAMKTTDKSKREEIRLTPDAGKVKRLGRNLEIREDWEDLKLDVMFYGVTKKFSKDNPELMQKLIALGDVYIQEGNRWGDKFWGVCLKTDTGQNNLGKIIMKVQRSLIDAKQ
jgi:ribA/ribD-fused uncharacterized protein